MKNKRLTVFTSSWQVELDKAIRRASWCYKDNIHLAYSLMFQGRGHKANYRRETILFRYMSLIKEK